MALYSFGATLRGPLPGLPDSLTDEVTDIAGAISALGRERDRLNIRAAIILSDGAVTRGETPRSGPRARAFRSSLSASGIPRRRRTCSSRASWPTTSSTRAARRQWTSSSGARDTAARRRRSRWRRERACWTGLSSRFPRGRREVPARLAYTPAEAGRRRYTVRVAAQSGELTAQNNARSFSATVLRSTTRVLLLAAGPDPDLSAVRGALGENTNVSLRVFTQKLGGGYYEGTPGARAADSADCILAIGMPDRDAGGSGRAHPLDDHREADAAPLHRRQEDRSPPAPLRCSPSLPVAARRGRQARMEVEFAPDPSRMDHPLLALGAVGGPNAWKRPPPRLRAAHALPPARRIHSAGLAPGEERRASPAVHGAAGRGGNARALRDGVRPLAMAAHGAGKPGTATLLSSFLSSAIRWLTGPEGERTVRVHPGPGAVRGRGAGVVHGTGLR